MTTSNTHHARFSEAHLPTQRLLGRALAALFWGVLVLLVAGSAALLG
ncbi:MAG: hypothetical protein GY725_11430 [bacterium]|nr:hypothetical protein [bacterium]